MVKRLLFAFSIFSFLCFSSAAPSIDTYLEDGETFSEIELANGYYLVLINASPAFLADSNGLVLNSTEIEYFFSPYLSGTYLSKVQPSQQDISSVLDDLNEFNASRAREADCKRYLGTDVYDCFDRDSCMYACYTPLCKGMLQGVGEPFFTSFVSFEEKLSLLDTQVSNLSGSILLSYISEGNASFVLSQWALAFQGVFTTAENVSNNKLFRKDGFDFCHPLNYSFSSLERANSKLLRLSVRLQLFQNPVKLKNSVLNATLSRVSLKASKDDCANKSLSASASLASFNSNFVQLSGLTELAQARLNLTRMASLVSVACSARKFSDANHSFDEFNAELARQEELLNPVMQEYSDTLRVATAGLQHVSSISTSGSSPELESARKTLEQVRSELPLASNASEVNVLHSVALDALKTVSGAPANSSNENNPNADFDLGPIVVILLLAALAFYFLKKK